MIKLMKIQNKYVINEQIGVGSFGFIYKGTNIRTNEKVAIKMEPIKNNTKLLKNESTIYQYLLNVNGVPTIKWFGKDEINYYMVINLLGESLQSFVEKRGPIPLKLTMKIGLQILYLLKDIHEKGLVHRDVKPDNFLIGIGKK
jgi:serine/threonine protein kinase